MRPDVLTFSGLFAVSFLPCVNCGRFYTQHSEAKCLFGATRYTPLNRKQFTPELYERAKEAILDAGLGSYTTMDLHNYLTNFCPHPSFLARVSEEEPTPDNTTCTVCGLNYALYTLVVEERAKKKTMADWEIKHDKCRAGCWTCGKAIEDDSADLELARQALLSWHRFLATQQAAEMGVLPYAHKDDLVEGAYREALKAQNEAMQKLLPEELAPPEPKEK